MEENKSSMLAILTVIIVIVIGLAIFLLSQNNQSNTINNPVSSPSSDDSISFKLTSQNNSGQNGTVTFEENGNTTKVSIFIDEPSTSNEPAHIHLGSCPTPGAVKYPLTNVISGTSVTNINVKFSDLKALGALSVNIHKSLDEIDTYVSCGDLSF